MPSGMGSSLTRVAEEVAAAEAEALDVMNDRSSGYILRSPSRSQTRKRKRIRNRVGYKKIRVGWRSSQGYESGCDTLATSTSTGY